MKAPQKFVICANEFQSVTEQLRDLLPKFIGAWAMKDEIPTEFSDALVALDAARRNLESAAREVRS